MSSRHTCWRYICRINSKSQGVLAGSVRIPAPSSHLPRPTHRHRFEMTYDPVEEEKPENHVSQYVLAAEQIPILVIAPRESPMLTATHFNRSPRSSHFSDHKPDDDLPSLEYDLTSKVWRIAIFWTLVILDSFAIPIILYFVLNYSTTLSKKQGMILGQVQTYYAASLMNFQCTI